MVHKRIALILSLLIAALLACQASLPFGTDPSLDSTSTALANEIATLSAQQTTLAQVPPAATLTATPDVNVQATAAQATQEAQNAESTHQAVNAQQTQAAQGNVQETAQAQNMANIVQDLFSKGIIPRAEGTYYSIPEYDESWAQINWYQWKDTGFSPEKFVLKAHTYWSSASDKANWFSSGCGFVIGLQDKENHHIVYLGLDGYARLASMLNGTWKTLVQRFYGKLEVMEGEADIILAVVDRHVVYIVNGKTLVDANPTTLKPGALNLTLLSGTNAGYGTRCVMSEIGLWEIK